MQSHSPWKWTQDLVMVGALTFLAAACQNPTETQNRDPRPQDLQSTTGSSPSPTLSDGQFWYRGQVHIHANWGVPNIVPTTSHNTAIEWYAQHDYNFVVLTDLNNYHPAEGLKLLWDWPGRFLVIPGTELNTNPGGKIVDSLGLGTTHLVQAPPDDFPGSVSDILNEQAARIRGAGGLTVVAHPNLTYAVTAADILQLTTEQAGDPLFFEVMNGEPGMNNLGGGGMPSTEEIWDDVLSRGRLLYGLGVDDSHHFFSDQFGPQYANPGRSWIMVRAPELTQRAVFDAIKQGAFYATTGVELLDYQVSSGGISIHLDNTTRDLGWSLPHTNPQLYRTEFIGAGGVVLAVDESVTPSYRFQGHEQYVRARIVSSDGLKAWTQPVFPTP